MNETEFIRHYIAHAPQIMWFLGAGASRTAGMPSASDIIWDLKLRYYCLKENEDISLHDINNDKVRLRIQGYLDSQGFPGLNSMEEYSFYFDLTFGDKYGEQQAYLSEKLSSSGISLNVGHRALAALVGLGKTKLIFTTNFDHVIEEAHSLVTGKNLPSFHLEGSYAALEALNAEAFPVYAKLHGDFKYQSVKNLSADLLSNDRKIQDCFLAAASRFGLVISGYSGRDSNVMEMLHQAIRQHNAFPAGLFWTVINRNDVSDSVLQFIEEARKQNINAHVVETGTFDTILSRIWRQLPDKGEFDSKVRSLAAQKVSIPFAERGSNYPLLRTNALNIIECPTACIAVSLKKDMSHEELVGEFKSKKVAATLTKFDKIIGWGSDDDLKKLFGDNLETVTSYSLSNAQELVQASTTIRSLIERTLAIALCNGKPLSLRINHGRFYAIVNHEKLSSAVLAPLKTAVAEYGKTEGHIVGKISDDVFWSESCEINFEIRNQGLWLMLKPNIWIEPKDERQNQIDFMRKKRSRRYNKVANSILDAWIEILLGKHRSGDIVELKCFEDSKCPATFKINSRTAYSKR